MALSLQTVPAKSGEDEPSFEELLQDDPQDRAIYDAYAQTLMGEEKFDEAIAVYQRAVQMGDKLENNNGTSLQEAIKEVRSTKKFYEDMKKAPSWGQARKLSFEGGELVTNIPQEYSEPMVRSLGSFVAEEKTMLEEILGLPKKEKTFLRISVAGRPEEYKVLWRQKDFSKKELASGGFNVGKNEIIVFFTGGDIRWTLAHEFAHYFLREFYTEQPSRFLDEGLANFLSLKLGKTGAKAVAEEILGRLKSLREEGELKSALDLFPAWERYEQSPDAEKKEDFYLRAWSLTAFFLDGKNAFFRKFFLDYIQYEFQTRLFSPKDAERYFRANLPEDKIRELDEEWGRFIDQMNYDNL